MKKFAPCCFYPERFISIFNWFQRRNLWTTSHLFVIAFSFLSFIVFCLLFFFTWVSITFRDFRRALRNRAKTRVVKTMLWNHAWSGQLDFNSKWNVKKKLSIKSMETLPLLILRNKFSYIFKLSGDLFCHVTKTWRRLAVLA